MAPAAQNLALGDSEVLMQRQTDVTDAKTVYHLAGRQRSGFSRWFGCCSNCSTKQDETTGADVIPASSTTLSKCVQTTAPSAVAASSAFGAQGRTARPHPRAPASECDWHDAMSDFSCDASETGASDCEEDNVVLIEQDQQQQQPKSLYKPPMVPAAPIVDGLLFGNPAAQYVAVPAKTPFLGNWDRDAQRTTPAPKPINLVCKDNWLTRVVIESIHVVEFKDYPDRIEVHARPTAAGSVPYTETFKKDGSVSSWLLRRDMRPGRSYGRMGLTAEGELILKVWTKPVFSNTIDTHFEDYITLQPSADGATVEMVIRQFCKHTASGGTAQQLIYGTQPAALVRL